MKRKRVFTVDHHRRQTQSRLIAGGLLILLGVGGGLVGLLYGRTAALTVLLCLSAAAGIFGLLWLILAVLDLFVKEDEP
jgi:hypothetical protein